MTHRKFPVIYADFQNADPEGFIRLNNVGTVRDLALHGIVLRPDLELWLSDGELSIVGVVKEPGAEKVWRASIEWNQLINSS